LSLSSLLLLPALVLVLRLIEVMIAQLEVMVGTSRLQV